MPTITFFNVAGRPVGYLADDNETIFLFDGTPAGYVTSGSVYTYSGAFLGWFEKGWVINRRGERVFYTETAEGGPVRPLRMLRPLAALRALRPMKIIRELRPSHPVPLPVWAPDSGESFFGTQNKVANF